MTEVFETLLPIRPTGTRPPLYCVHPVSGSAYVYAALASLAPDMPIYGFEAPGFDDGRDPFTTLGGLSAEYARFLGQFRQDDPYCLLGYSMGGAIAFDMARRLAAAGREVPVVVIIDTAVPKRMALPPERAMLGRFVRDMMGVSGMTPIGVDSLLDGPSQVGTTPTVFEKIEQAGIFPPELDAEFLADRYGLFRAHIAALFDHEERGPYDGRVLLLKATGTPAESMNWASVASEVEEHTIPGDHYSIWTGDGLEAMLEILGRVLDSVKAAPARAGR